MKVLIIVKNNEQAYLINESIKLNYPEFDLLTAPSYASAQVLIEANHFQIFIIDIDLCEDESMTGIAFAKYIKSLPEYSYNPLILISSSTAKIDPAINDIHCYNYLIKPHFIDRLLFSLSSLLNTPTLLPPIFEFKGNNGLVFHLNPNDKYISKYTAIILFYIRQITDLKPTNIP